MNPLRSKTIQLIASLALVLAFIVPAQAATVTPARFLPGDDAIQAASHDQVAPNISFGSQSSLVVWGDKRSNPTGFILQLADGARHRLRRRARAGRRA